MAFVNEYISDEDMEKYDIRSVWARFDRIKSNEERDMLMGKYSWTIDRERDIFFIPVEWGREEFSNEITSLLSWGGAQLLVKIANMGGYLDYPSKAGSVKWGLLDIKAPDVFHASREDIVSVLKEVLIVYQLDGVSHPMHSFAVTFNF